MQGTAAPSRPADIRPPTADRPEPRRLLRGLVILGGLVVAIVIGSRLGGGFPESWNLHIGDVFDSFEKWVTDNRATHPAFTYFFNPVKDGLEASVEAVTTVLNRITWLGVLAAAGVIGGLVAGWRMGLFAVAGMASLGVLGLWQESMDTLGLMVVCVGIALAIGIPLGILAGLSDRVEKGLRPLLDTAQTMPAYVYLLPCVLLFLIGNPPAVIATVIFAIPPAVRLTNHGLRGVPPTTLEVARSFGSTSRQTLRKVQLPLAKPSIMLGVNQTLMMAFGVVVIAAVVGVSGLGRVVFNGLQFRRLGQAFTGGLAIVILAIVLDRVSYAWSRRGRVRRRPPTIGGRVMGRRELALASTAVVLAAIGIGRYLLVQEDFPDVWALSFNEPVDALVGWMRVNLTEGVPVIGGTNAIRDGLLRYGLDPLRDLLLGIPWWMVTGGVGLIAWRAAGVRVAVVSAACFLAIGLLGTWDLSMDTLSQVVVAVALSVAIAVPLGIVASMSNGFDRAIRPLLDAMQTMPAFVYLVPVIVLFDPGRVPGLVAALIYALPPAIRLTTLGIREVPKETTEAAIAFGSTRGQLLRKVQLPLAKRSIMLGINQTIMMVLSVVIIAGLIGGGALGFEVVVALTRGNIGQGVEAGISIVLLAIVLDRVTQALGAPKSRTTGRGPVGLFGGAWPKARVILAGTKGKGEA